MKNKCLTQAYSIDSAQETPDVNAAELTWNRVDNDLFFTAASGCG
jgi:hypothetical protein